MPTKYEYIVLWIYNYVITHLLRICSKSNLSTIIQLKILIFLLFCIKYRKCYVLLLDMLAAHLYDFTCCMLTFGLLCQNACFLCTFFKQGVSLWRVAFLVRSYNELIYIVKNFRIIKKLIIKTFELLRHLRLI